MLPSSGRDLTLPGRLVSGRATGSDRTAAELVGGQDAPGAMGVVNTDGATGADRVLDARAFMNEIRARLVAEVFPLFR